MYDIDQEQKEYEYEVVLPLYELKEIEDGREREE